MTDLPAPPPVRRGGLPVVAIVLLLGICAVWAGNAVLLRYAIGLHDLPPIHVAAGRFAIVALLLSPLLLRRVERLPRVLLAGLLMGACHFGFLMLGYERITAVASAVLLQLGIPVTAVLSMSAGREPVSGPRLALVALAPAAIVWAIGDPGSIDLIGGLCIALAALSLAAGSVLMAGLRVTGALTLQAWTAICSAIALCGLARLLEPTGLSDLAAQPMLSAVSIVLPALVVTIGAHTVYYHLLRSHPPSLVSAVTILFPVMTILLGALLLSEPVTPRFLAGAMVSTAVLAALVLKRA